MVTLNVTKQVLSKIQEDQENRICFDCASSAITHASANLGIFLCSYCASVHSKFGDRISAVRSLNGKWDTKDLKVLVSGGNSSLKMFFSMYGIKMWNEDKYKTIACEYYRELLQVISGTGSISSSPPSLSQGAQLLPALDSIPETLSFPISVRSSLSLLSPISENLNLKLPSINSLTSDAKSFLNQSKDWASNQLQAGLRWSSFQKDRLLSQMNINSLFISQAEKVYNEIQSHLCIVPLREETFQLIRKSNK